MTCYIAVNLLAFHSHHKESRGWEECCVFLVPRVVSSDLHKKTCQQGFLNVEGVAAGAEGGSRDGHLDPLQGVCELSVNSVGHQQRSVVQVEILTPFLHITV